MDINYVIIIAVALLAVVLALIYARASGGKRVAPPTTPDQSVVDSAAEAVEDVAEQFLGIETDETGPPDDLTRLKGLGPKAAAALNAIGITRYAQLAALDERQVAAVDARMGNFKGRIQRDRWVEQAGYLASGDTAGFEAVFGKLG